MMELAAHWRSPGLEVEVWGGAKMQAPPRIYTRNLRGLSRANRWIRGFSWHRRYTWEQLSLLPQTLLLLRSRKIDLVYCGDPVLSWHLKQFRRFHRAKVVFMNGMRLSPGWSKDFDGVHLLAPAYLESARRDLNGSVTANLFAVPHFVDVTRFTPASREQRAWARREFALGETDFIVLTTGPVGTVSNKRLAFLAQEVAAAGDGVVLVSAGDDEDGAGDVRSQCIRALGKRMRLLGPVHRSKMPELYRAADVYSLGALAEPFSISILEALASGLPIVHHSDQVTTWVAGDGGIPVSMTTHGEAGRMFSRLKHDEEWRNALRKSARDLAEMRYSPSIVCADLARHLERLCQT
jgi:glycosyltransferase involved in cell wall biosynthesis